MYYASRSPRFPEGNGLASCQALSPFLLPGIGPYLRRPESTEQLVSTPEVHLDDAVFTGLGIPFAHPPTNERRLRQPEPLPPYQGLYYVQEYGKSCSRQRLDLSNGLDSRLVKDIAAVVNILYENLTPADEDCLNINVVKPSSATPGSKLPVIYWIFGGGFEIGEPSIYDGGGLVARSIDLGQPVIYVSEVKAEKVGNLGLQDQRLGLKWVQTYISEFGGDPSKVTIAGAISVAHYMVANNGNNEGLFRDAIVQSGGPIPVGDIENGKAQNTLDCLRKVPYATYKKAMDDSPNFFAYQVRAYYGLVVAVRSGLVLAWLPRLYGVFLTRPTQYSVLLGDVANVAMITGNCDGEGTLFAVSTINITTTAELKDYMKLYMMPKAKDSLVDLLLKYYPDDQRAGSPFDTGMENMLSPQFKRTAALQGDFVFHSPRRADKQKSWVYKRGKTLPFLGAAHGTDLLNSFGVGPALSEFRDYFIRFTNHLDPNGKAGLGVPWPQWDSKHPKAVIFKDGTLFPIVIGDDDYRTDALNYVSTMSLLYPI
ncbi:carotenoid ester lipase precursor [Lactarius indigo]|nr:carotenoid ester lipase precursor [Lactarius indigo]